MVPIATTQTTEYTAWAL